MTELRSTLADPKSGVLVFDQFEQVLIAVAREVTEHSSWRREFLAAFEARPDLKFIFCVRDEFRSAFDTLGIAPERCEAYCLQAFSDQVAAAILGCLLQSAGVKFEKEYLASLCSALAEGTPLCVPPTILQIIAQNCSFWGRPLTQQTAIERTKEALFKRHLTDQVLGCLSPQIQATEVTSILLELCAGSVKAPPRTIPELVHSIPTVKEAVIRTVLAVATMPQARVVTEIHDFEKSEGSYQLTHDAFVPPLRRLHGELTAEAKLNSRRNRLIVSIATGLLVTALLVALFLVQSQRSIAMQFAESLRLSNLAETTLAKDPTTALKLELNAISIQSSDPGQQHVRKTFAENTMSTTLYSTDKKITDIAIAADTSMIASTESSVLLLNADGQQKAVLDQPTETVTSVAISADARYGLVCSQTAVKLWDLGEKRIRWLSNETGNRAFGTDIGSTSYSWDTDVSFSIAGTEFVTCPGSECVVHRSNGTEIARLSGHSSKLFTAAFSPNGRLIATGSHDKTAAIWDRTGRRLHELRGHQFPVSQVAFSPDSKFVITGSFDFTAKVWDANTGKLLQTMKEVNAIITAMSVFGDYFAVGYLNGSIVLWSMDGILLAHLKGHLDEVSGIGAAGREVLISGSHDGTIRRWDLRGRIPEKILNAHRQDTYAVTWSADGKLLATGSKDNTGKIWTADGRELATLTGHTATIRSIVFARRSDLVLTASEDKSVKLWKTTGRLLDTFIGHTAPVAAAALIQNESQIISADYDGVIKVWSMKGEQIRSFKGHEERIFSLVVSEDGQSFVSGGRDGMVKVWNTTQSQARVTRRMPQPVRSVTFLNPNSILIGDGQGGIHRWNLPQGTMTEILYHRGSVRGLQPVWQDSFVSAAEDHGAALWEGGFLRQSMRSQPDHATALAMNPVTQKIAVACKDGSVYIYSVAESLESVLSRGGIQPLTAAELKAFKTTGTNWLNTLRTATNPKDSQ